MFRAIEGAQRQDRFLEFDERGRPILWVRTDAIGDRNCHAGSDINRTISAGSSTDESAEGGARLSGDTAGVFVTCRKNPLGSKRPDKTICKRKPLKLRGRPAPSGLTK
jgi:hypothetical protein